MLTWSLHFPFTSDQVHPPFVSLTILTFTASSSDVGDQDIHHLIRHSHSTRLCVCDRVGVYLLMERKWNSIAIIKHKSEQCSRYPVLNYLTNVSSGTFLAWRMNVYFLWTFLEMTNLRLNSKNHYWWNIYYITSHELAKCKEPLPNIPCDSHMGGKVGFGKICCNRINVTADISLLLSLSSSLDSHPCLLKNEELWYFIFI